MKNELNDHFVEGGYERAWSANFEREYAERRQSAGRLKRWLLYWEMRREITRRLDRLAPPWALYFCS